MGEPTPSIGQGSAPVAIILALALAATVGVSAQSWDARGAARQSAPGKPGGGTEAGSAAAAESTDPASVLRLVADWVRGDRSSNCASPPR